MIPLIFRNWYIPKNVPTNVATYHPTTVWECAIAKKFFGKFSNESRSLFNGGVIMIMKIVLFCFYCFGNDLQCLWIELYSDSMMKEFEVLLRSYNTTVEQLLKIFILGSKLFGCVSLNMHMNCMNWRCFIKDIHSFLLKFGYRANATRTAYTFKCYVLCLKVKRSNDNV